MYLECILDRCEPGQPYEVEGGDDHNSKLGYTSHLPYAKDKAQALDDQNRSSW
jgi:hypothetical protein